VSSGPHLFPSTETPPEPVVGPGRTGAVGESKFAYGLVIFSSAFLLFEVQPLIAKLILPWFGGVAAVWAVCLVFFQTVLLLGYLYAHLLTRKFRRRAQGRIHAALLAASLLVLPILPRSSWQPSGHEDPALYILWLLTLTIGLPFFLLSSTSPLLQAWYARSRPGVSPYRFYSLSNVGSLLALIVYPVVIEPKISNTHQAVGWSAAYVAIAALYAAMALRRPSPSAAKSVAAPDAPAPTPRPGWKLQALWISLAACGSALLLAVTNHITQNVASVPFLWVLPLGLYLFSFILCFEGQGWYRPSLFLRLHVVGLGGMAYALSPAYSGLPLIVLLPLFCFGLFICCMFCHGELARLKPDPSHLTLFYLMLSLGGALGAAFVALVAPRIFSGFYELQISLGACAVLIHVVHRRDPASPFHKARPLAARVGLATLIVIFVGALLFTVHEQDARAIAAVRNFYGVLRVKDQGTKVVMAKVNDATLVHDGRYRVLVNGTIDHGLQFLAPDRRDLPTAYYGPNSGIGVVLRAIEGTRPLRVAIIGLGAGTLATYGHPGDRYTFYEINPLDELMARTEFTFLRDSRAEISIVPGDARLSLEHEPPQRYDVLAVDAFTGDSIPVHLLTIEAFRLYFRNLAPQGVLAIHISNRYLNLAPVVAAAAMTLDKEAIRISNPDDRANGIFSSSWVLVGASRSFEAEKQIEAAGQMIRRPRRNQLWTDDYSSLFRVLK
jgi:hypothetical protein